MIVRKTWNHNIIVECHIDNTNCNQQSFLSFMLFFFINTMNVPLYLTVDIFDSNIQLKLQLELGLHFDWIYLIYPIR